MKKKMIGVVGFVSMLLAGCTVGTAQVTESSYIEESVDEVEVTTLGATSEVEESDQLYSFDDFKGYYGQFSLDDSDHVETLIIISENYVTVGWWMSEYEVMEITEKSIEGDTLIIDFFQEADGAYVLQDVSGTFEITLQEEEGKKSVSIEGGESFYSLTEQEVEGYEFIVQDFVLEDM